MKKLKHKFVDLMPKPLEDGILYISPHFGIVSHNCACGCRNEVVLNLSPKGWQLAYDGESVTLYPSIGSWNLKCQSHYWIRNNEIQWAPKWTKKQIEVGCDRDGFNEKEDTSFFSFFKRKKGR